MANEEPAFMLTQLLTMNTTHKFSSLYSVLQPVVMAVNQLTGRHIGGHKGLCRPNRAFVVHFDPHLVATAIGLKQKLMSLSRGQELGQLPDA